MVEFRTLGSIDLRGDGAAKALAAKGKRVALLVYLAAARPAGSHRRDSLLGLLWPDLDQSHARNALSQSLYTLRRVLGRDAILNVGDDDVALAPGAVWCDAAAFHDLLEAGEEERALELYRGDFLPGFFVPGAIEFEHWVEAERDRLRRRAAEATARLAERELSAGRRRQASRWARRGLELDPFDEAALCRLMSLEADGDRIGALKAYEDFAVRIGRELEVSPSPEIQNAAERLRASVGRTPPLVTGRLATGPLVTGPTVGGRTPRGATTTTVRAERLPLRPRRGFRMALLGVPLAAAVAVAMLLRRDAIEREPYRTADRVAVLPFSFTGDATFAHLARGVVDLLSMKLDGAGRLRSVDPRAVANVTEAAQAGTEPNASGRLAQRLNASHYVVGSIVEAGGRLQLAASLYRVDGELESVGRVEIAGESDIFDGIDALVARLLANRVGGPEDQLERTAALTSRSLPALKAYLAGERLLRQGRYSAAADEFQRALSLDNDFALASYRLTVAQEWSAGYGLTPAIAAEMPRADRPLPRRIRLLLEARDASAHGAAAEAERLYRDLLTAYPDDMEAWYGLGEVLFHYGPARGQPRSLAELPFQRVLAFDSLHAAALWHLAQIAALERRPGDLEHLLGEVLHLNPDNDRALEMRALHAFTAGDEASRDRALAELRDGGARIVLTSAWRVAVSTHDLDGATRIARLLTDATRPREVRALGNLLLAHIALAGGRLAAAEARLHAMADVVPTWSAQYRAFFAALPFTRSSSEELRQMHAVVAALDPSADDRVSIVDPFLSVHNGAHPLLRLYLLGLLESALSQHYRVAPRLADLVEPPFPVSAEHTLLPARLARSLRAQLALSHLDHRPADLAVGLAPESEAAPRVARAILDAPLPGSREEIIAREPLNRDALDRYQRAQLLAAEGKHEEALRWFRTFEEGSILDLIYLGPSYLERARIHEQRGEPVLAATHYAHFSDLWHASDERFSDLLAEARSRLAALQPTEPH